jgi:hypothetical protein
MQVPRTTPLTLRDCYVLEILNPAEAPSKRVKILLEADLVDHVFSVGQRNHPVCAYRFAAKTNLLLRALRGIHKVLLSVLRLPALGTRKRTQALRTHVAIKPSGSDFNLPVAEITTTDHPFPAKGREISYTLVVHCNSSL